MSILITLQFQSHRLEIEAKQVIAGAIMGIPAAATAIAAGPI